MAKQSKTWSDLALTAVLAGVAVTLVVVLVLTQTMLDNRYKRYETPPTVVLEFLGAYIPLQSTVEQESVLEEYFSCVDKTNLLHNGGSMDLLRINSVLIERSDKRVVSFRVCSARKNYLEFMPIDEDGNDCPCRVGLFYQIGGDGRISSYNIYRLQPISRKDAEWNGAWL